MGADLQGRIGNDIGDFADLIVRRANAFGTAPLIKDRACFTSRRSA
jgi:hypothetical protein